ncbi:hypothetical protein PIB30_001868 [Stylosanthes scabra]|uniref:C2H2-type domain-containing protein n=1 Tax=Stylosanthes scabra TaxID=79078 RepID=A0ABU6X2Z4_9FABA|nr:hypothetical protein [Stylosanthes scabra]
MKGRKQRETSPPPPPPAAVVAKYTCINCKQEFEEFVDMMKHSEDNHGDKPFLCKDCANRVSTEKTLEAHRREDHMDMEEHADEEHSLNPHVCKQCANRFFTQIDLDMHRVECIHFILSAERYRCIYCDHALFDTYELMLDHSNKKHSEGFLCDSCANRIITKKLLKIHQSECPKVVSKPSQRKCKKQN